MITNSLESNYFAANQQPIAMTTLAMRGIGVMLSPRKQMVMKAPMKGYYGIVGAGFGGSDGTMANYKRLLIGVLSA